MSSNNTYNSFSLKKTTYKTYENGVVIKKYKMGNPEQPKKVAHVVIQTDESGKKVCKIVYKKK